MTDIVERLRALAQAEHGDLSVGDEAADEIEGLRKEVLEQARLLGMSGEREASLRGLLFDCQMDLGRQKVVMEQQLATVTKERDEWKSEALDHCEKVVKQANATLSDRHYMRVMDEQLSELTNFAKRVASLPWHGEYVTLIDEANAALAKVGADKTGE